MAKRIMVDTGFWYALYENRDAYHEEALILADVLAYHHLILPWPCLYETLNTRFVKRHDWMASFTLYITRQNTTRLPDEDYRHHALESLLRSPRTQPSRSLVDEVIRLALRDPKLKIDALVTFNPFDFQDICYAKNIELVSA